MDHRPITGEIKGGSVALQHHVFIITSNFTIGAVFAKLPPETILAIARRCEVVECRERQCVRTVDRCMGTAGEPNLVPDEWLVKGFNPFASAPKGSE